VQQLQRGRLVAALLDQHVQHLAFIVHGAPKKHSSPADLHHHLIEMPSGRGRLPALWQVGHDERSELDHPAAHRFATHDDPRWASSSSTPRKLSGNLK